MSTFNYLHSFNNGAATHISKEPLTVTDIATKYHLGYSPRVFDGATVRVYTSADGTTELVKNVDYTLSKRASDITVSENISKDCYSYIIITKATGTYYIDYDVIASYNDGKLTNDHETRLNSIDSTLASHASDLFTHADQIASIKESLGIRDYIINGAFKYWFDNTGLSAESGFRYTATLNKTVCLGTGATLSISRNASTAAIQEFCNTTSPYYLTATSTTGSDSAGEEIEPIFYHIEDVRKLAGKMVCLSLWAKASSPTVISVGANQVFGSGGSASVSVSAQLVTLDTTMNRYDIVITFPSVVGKTISLDSHSVIRVWTSSGSTYSADAANMVKQSSVIDIYKMQLIDGDVYRYVPERDEQEEISLIERYYETGFLNGTVPGDEITNTSHSAIMLGASYPSTTWLAASSILAGTITYRQRKRITNPTFTTYNAGTAGTVRRLGSGATITTSQSSYLGNDSGVSALLSSATPFVVGGLYSFNWTSDARF